MEFLDLPEHKRQAIAQFLQRAQPGVTANFFAA
jgi:hypothetical protein